MVTYSKSDKYSCLRTSCSLRGMTPVADIVTGKVEGRHHVYLPLFFHLMLNSAYFIIYSVYAVCRLLEFGMLTSIK